MHPYSSYRESSNLILLQGIVSSWWMNRGPSASDTWIRCGAELGGAVSSCMSLGVCGEHRGPPILCKGLRKQGMC